MALPLAMAFAIASGVPPARGLYTAIVAGFLISFLGGSRVQIGGPTGAFVVIVFGIVQKYGYDGLVVAMVLAGLMLIAMGLARFGVMIKYIPYPVTVGFTSGIALIIFSSQMRDFLGLQMKAVPAHFFEKWGAYAQHLSTWNPYALGIGILSLGIFLWFRKKYPRLPGAILAVLIASLLVWIFDLPVETIQSRFGDVPRTLPAPHFPSFSLTQIRNVFPEAVTIALLAAIESLLSAVVADGMIGGRHKSNVELMAQGVANIASAAFGGIPATGAIARTATNVKSGAKTPVAGIIHAVTLGLFLFILGPYAGYIPLATLAAILIVVAWNMSEKDHFKYLLRAPKGDIAILLSVFTLTVAIDLTVAVQVGVVMAAFLFMKRMSEVTTVGAHSILLEDENGEETEPMEEKELPKDVEVFEINGPFFFGVADKLKDVLDELEKPAKAFILRMRHVPAVDATGLHALEELFYKCKRHGTTLILSGVNRQPKEAMQKVGLDKRIGTENIFPHFDLALERARNITRVIKSA